ncbi:MAG: filamentous hemagglutinin N-terminal domain-containing protein, partial [Pseudomonadales bacterium]|nr:filamentous hemagglutinin N-terminal domain-containing protein [Pseudomonadales bacterium]
MSFRCLNTMRKTSITVIATLLHLNVAWGLPEGATITGGSGHIQQKDNALSVHQSSDKISINYDSFDIGRKESVQFIQPHQDSIALNRVTGVNASQILGNLQANGQIFLINPNGIIFGTDAVIEVAGLLATTLQLSDADFFASDYVFKETGQQEGISTAKIINQGLIQAAEKGYIALISHHVSNEGKLISNNGTIELHSTDQVLVNLSQQTIAIESTQATVDGLIENHGLISNEGGYIVLNSHALDTLHETVVNNTGIIRATSLMEENGEVVIKGSQGDIFNDGDIDVSANGSGVNGGNVNITANRIAQRGKITADGKGNGHGGNIHLHADTELFATNGSVATANGGEQGNGGNVVYFSDERALFEKNAGIESKGGHLTGDGGFVEVSGRHWVSAQGSVDTRAQNGNTGVYLIDPTDITIVAGNTLVGGSFGTGTWTSDANSATIGADDINDQLLTSNVIINTDTADGGGPYGGTGDINVNAAIDLNGGTTNTLSLVADNNLNINANICDGGAACLATPDDNVGLNFTASGNLTIADGVQVNSGNAKISIIVTSDVQVTGLVSSNTDDDAVAITTNGAINNSG